VWETVVCYAQTPFKIAWGIKKAFSKMKEDEKKEQLLKQNK